MDNESSLTLLCIRKNGKRESTKLNLCSVSEAREVAMRVLHLGNGVYTEVDICDEDGTIERIPNPAVSKNSSEVLLVEDNAGDALLVGQALAECRMSVHLHIARDGEQALQILKEPDFNPDLVILDLSIPKISGYSVLASYPLNKTPVVVFTASQNEADEGRALSLGAKEFVRKPIELQDYKSAVCSMVRKWAAPNERGDAATLWL